MSVPYIGATINLISKAEIRYVGKLAQVDQQKSTVTLQNVQSFGTEGRRPGSEVPPSDQVFEFIVFRGSDIKDLHVTNVSQPPQPQQQAFADPAIIQSSSASAQKQQQQKPQQVQPQQPKKFSQVVKNQTDASGGNGKASTSTTTGPRDEAEEGSRYNNNNRREPRTGDRQQNRRRENQDRRQQPPHQHQPKGKPVEVPATDFDFESSNAKLDKKDMVSKDEELAQKLSEIKLENVYDKKKSFFDNISSDIKDRNEKVEPQEVSDRRKFRDEDRKLNLETFGVAGVRSRNFRGRGRGRGGNRGGYNNRRGNSRPEKDVVEAGN